MEKASGEGFPGSSACKESACLPACLPGSIPGLGRSAGEGIGYSLQYSWSSLVAKLLKNLPAMWETWVWSLGWEDPLEKGTATHSSIPACRSPWTIVHGIPKSWIWLSNFHFHILWRPPLATSFPSLFLGLWSLKESTKLFLEEERFPMPNMFRKHQALRDKEAFYFSALWSLH